MGRSFSAGTASFSASWAAPRPGVFVTAPQSTPTIIGRFVGSLGSNTR